MKGHMICFNRNIRYFVNLLSVQKLQKNLHFIKTRTHSSISLKMSSKDNNKKTLIAVCQMNSKEDKDQNWAIGSDLIRKASQRGCEVVFLPECFDMICDSKQKTLSNTEPIDGPIITKYRDLAKETNVWLSLGGLHEKNSQSADGKAFNAHILIDNKGNIASVYRKVHLFNLEIPGVVRLLESEFCSPGDRVVKPVETPAGKIGLGICYDLRFAEFAISLAKSGADIITYPSSFTVPTGSAHWESLLRARAIETQCYVVAAAQTGTHNTKRSSYGHAMVVDPWGSIIAQCSDQIGFAIAQIDFDFLQNARKKLPVWSDRKPQIYGNIIPAQDFQNLSIDSEQTFEFGPTAKVHSLQVFYRTQHTIAFVNHRPVLPGHVLVAPIREAKRLRDLNSDEITDLFLTVQKVQQIIEREFSASASTVAIQDGIDAGQSIEHLHVHLLPRKPTDFGGKIDQIYMHLQKHDKVEHSKNFRLKTNDEMAFEASKLRKYFSN